MPRLLLVLLVLSGAVGRGGAADDPKDQAQRLIRQASELSDGKKYDEALKLLAQAQQLAPGYPLTQSWLAHVYELQGDKPQALTHVAALFALDPKSDYARDAARRLFYTPPFPRVLTAAAVAISPLRFVVDRCLLGDDRVSGAPSQIGLCYTTSLKYPEDGTDGGPVVDRALPLPGDKPQIERFNRVAYGYLEQPDTGDLKLRVIAYYPSTVLSGADQDLAPTAQALVHLTLRFLCYSERVLGLPPQGDAEGVNRLWLALGGPPGAQRSESDIFLYRTVTDQRTPVEWVRQLAHECGHLLIPRVGGFAAPEMWGNGGLGERLFIQLLAQEAARVSGTQWPSSAAAARLDGLWTGGHVAVEDYLASSGRAPLAVWGPAGPASELIVGEDERAMQYYLGFSLYLLASHGPAGLREVIKTATGTTMADFVYAYKQAVRRWATQGPVALGPGGYDPSATRLTVAPPAATLTPVAVTLAGGDQLTYPVFLPAAQWQLAFGLPDGAPAAKLLVTFDGGQEAEVTVGAGAKPVLIGPLTESWHKLLLRAPAEQPPLQLLRLVFGQPA